MDQPRRGERRMPHTIPRNASLFAHRPPLCNTSFMSLVKELLRPLAEDGAALTREQAAEVLVEILAGGVPEVETAALLAVLATRGEQAPELAGFVDVMRRHSVPIPFTEAERARARRLCRHRRRWSADLQHFLWSRARCRSRRSPRRQARQPRRHFALRRCRCPRGSRRPH